MEEKLEKYYKAQDALLELIECGYEDGKIRGTLEHLRGRIANIHTENEVTCDLI